jgi:hypothetical protein
MLFDHGTDSLASFIIAIQFLTIIQMSGSSVILSLFTFIMITYFSAMWAQYATGVFKLGRVNPVDEGIPAFALFSLLSIYLPI